MTTDPLIGHLFLYYINEVVTLYINEENVEEKYTDLQSRIIIRKDELDSFIFFLENETTWLNSPASTKYHLNIEKGLLIHSVGVVYTLLKIKNALMPQLDDESCIICALFHDVGKLGFPQKPLFLKGSNGYYYNPEVITMGLGVRSLYLISKHISLSDDEAQAIAYHDGQYIEENKIVAHKESPLLLLLHYADYWTAHIYEDEKRRKEYIESNFWAVLDGAEKEYGYILIKS